MTKEVEPRFKTAQISFDDWLVPHWKQYGIDILTIIPEETENVKRIVYTNVFSESARDIQDFVIHDLSNLANLHYLKMEHGGDVSLDEAFEAEAAELKLLIKYSLLTDSPDWSIESWIDFIGRSK